MIRRAPRRMIAVFCDNIDNSDNTGDMTSQGTARNQRQNGSRSSHFHCYLLHSLDPSHPYKFYIGFTTDPKRRLQQHNGDLKNGGARRTRHSGRPWKFVLVVHGFPDQVSALRFEWAWQHPGKSLHVRNAIGDTEAKQLSKRRGTKAALAILKTLLIECTSLCGHYALDLYFLEDKWRDEFSTIKTESGRGMPQSTTCKVVPGVKEMPFWKERRRERCATKKKGVVAENSAFSAVDDQISEVSHWCLLCYQSIGDDEMKCTSCSKGFHHTCLELEFEDESDETTSFPQLWTCPVCSTENGIIHQKQNEVVELTCEDMTSDGTFSNLVAEDFEFASEGYMSEDDGSDPQMIDRTAPSFDSHDVSSTNYDQGGCIYWESDDEECVAMSAVDSSLVEVTKGVHRQSIADTPRAQSANVIMMSYDLSQRSPEFIDLTMTPSVSQEKNRYGPSGSVPLIDLSQSPYS